ncbi:YdbL family protein [Aliikangiella maris]|uniref:YdbL family protein n=2 Tax=Aliikangiella maris TaxID=3162458 RepID=A0ABV2BX32_9GAMM
MKNAIQWLFAIMVLFSTQVFAINLTDAKKQGLIGEQYNGYLGIVAKSNTEVTELVQSTNEKRKEKYEEIAKKRGISLKEVEILAGDKAIEMTLSGNYIKLQNGSWQKKS